MCFTFEEDDIVVSKNIAHFTFFSYLVQSIHHKVIKVVNVSIWRTIDTVNTTLRPLLGKVNSIKTDSVTVPSEFTNRGLVNSCSEH